MKRVVALFLVLIMLTSSVHASIFGEENAALSGILTEEIIQTFHMAETISKLAAIVQSINKTVNIARESYRQFQYIKNYTVDDLLKDAKSGFCKGLQSSTKTSCRDWEEDLKEMYGNAEMLSTGKFNQFFMYRSKWDNQTRKFLKELYQGSARAYVYPKIAPKVSSYYGWDKHENDAEYVINQALVKSGLYDSLIETQKEGYTVSSAIGDFLRESEKSKNIVTKGQAVQLMQDQQRNKVLVEQNMRDKARFIHEENVKTMKDNEVDVFLDTYEKSSKEASKNDIIKVEVE